MNWEQLNEVLGNFSSLRYGRNKIATQVVKEIDSEGEQGESGLAYEIYKLTDELYIKLTISTDSYGNNEFVSGVQFVQPKSKVVTSFESASEFINKGATKKSYDQIIQVLKNKLDSVSDFAHGDYDTSKLGLGTIKQIEQHGGEDEGSNWYVVRHFVDHDVYVKVSGYYTSYEGTSFEDWEDSCEHVKPAQKTVTVYE